MCNDMDLFFKPIVLVTGFGPFLGHPVNASWEAVKLMNKEVLEKEHNIELVTLELPVTYSNVDEFVPALWDTHEPKLMIHVGVSRLAESLTLETQAHRKGYQRQDYLEQCPANHCCAAPGGGAVRLHTKLDVSRICAELNQDEELTAVESKDAGRYLCEYIYYTSLAADNTRTLFVHVPDMNVWDTARVTRGLERIVSLCLTQLRERESLNDTAGKMAEVSLQDTNEI
ncbi:pyroglutamyl-peptidase 1 [Cydia pomonella]|uniref:pyroglutamyl-peptidase 1 n=1 Tax=Cydia pomonella TaxID=82600 RepID=UPI002ADE37E1|nr:pyroglutamyl-peptidase 1 [Cydia pomonella]